GAFRGGGVGPGTSRPRRAARRPSTRQGSRARFARRAADRRDRLACAAPETLRLLLVSIRPGQNTRGVARLRRRCDRASERRQNLYHYPSGGTKDNQNRPAQRIRPSSYPRTGAKVPAGVAAMPLLDHFHGALRRRRHWESFHSSWATFIAQQLNRGVLPKYHIAEVHVSLGVQLEADVTAEQETGQGNGAKGSTATAVWAPPRPPLSVAVDFADIDLFEVQVVREDRDLRVVAAIELISPANKDRPDSRRAFAAKCLGYLHQGVGVVVVDVVTERTANLHAELLDVLGREAGEDGELPLYAAAYRTITRRKRCRLEAWVEELTLGSALPTMPLWISPTQAVPLELERSYQTTCEALVVPG